MLVAGGIMNQLDIAFSRKYSFGLVCIGLSACRLTCDKEAWESILQKDYFSEFTLMSVATLGAFYISGNIRKELLSCCSIQLVNYFRIEQ